MINIIPVRRWLLAILAAAQFQAACAAAPPDKLDTLLASVTPGEIHADMGFLADDLLEGRGTGTRGYLIGANYVASQFEVAGLKPGGDKDDWFQDIRFRSITVDAARTSFKVTNGGISTSYKVREDYLTSADPINRDVKFSAQLAFVGFGISAPDQHYDDYQGVDVKGKIVVALAGAPDWPSAIRAHYSANWVKRANAVRHGAVGYIRIWGPKYEAMMGPFSHLIASVPESQPRWWDAKEEFNDYLPELKFVGEISTAAARPMFVGSGHAADEIFEASKQGKSISFNLPGTADIHVVSTATEMHSPNVVGKLEGSDPKLKNQYVVYTAHLDHLGFSTPVENDRIYNGALDNASGVAAILAVARALGHSAVKPRRSILFVAVTGEETGLLGSDYFARHPTVPAGSIVANVNMDEDLMLWPLRDIVALGAEHSTMASAVNRAVKRLNILSSPDPEPDRVYFIRSDQYSFVRQGIPALSLDAGWTSSDPKISPKAISQNWEKQRYHQPTDDMDQPGLDFDAAALYTRTALLIGWYTANDDAAPSWNPGDFFGEAFAKKH